VNAAAPRGGPYPLVASTVWFNRAMLELTSPTDMRAWSRAERARGRRIGFVPTMGYLHEGHLRLVDRARERADRVVLSSFVNPLQFGAGEDFAKYPRDPGRDRRLAAERGVDCFFAPTTEGLYPVEPVVRIAPGPMADLFEGAVRPGHFGGVLTVVAKLFHLVEPDIAVFGRKDFQQALLVGHLARDLDYVVEIDIAPTVRELDGLALSSRNSYLHGDDRRAALALSRALRAVEQAWRGGQADPTVLERRGLEVLAAPGVAPEYVALVGEDLRPVTRADARTVVLVAARVGATRLIDNVVLGEGLAGDVSVRGS
jgi:pantoate--beta-alanine ligase